MFTWLCMVSLIDYLQPVRLWDLIHLKMRKKLHGSPPSPGYSYSCVPIWHESSRTGRGNNFKQDSFLPLSNSQVRKGFWCTHLQNCMGLVQAYPITQSSFCLVKWNSVLIPCIPLSRIPLGGSGVDEWLETTGQMNHACVHVRRRRRYQRMPPWMVFCLILIGILYTYRKVS